MSRVPSLSKGAHRVDTHLGANMDRLTLQGHRDGFHVEQRPTFVKAVTPVAQWWRTHLPTQKTQEMPVRSLGQEDPLEGETATHSNILAWKIPWTRGGWRTTFDGFAKSLTQLSSWTHTHTHTSLKIIHFPPMKLEKVQKIDRVHSCGWEKRSV